MFEIDDVIIYGAQGVCKIADIEEKSVGGVKKKYFILKPINDKGATIFAPTDNEHVLKKMRGSCLKMKSIRLKKINCPIFSHESTLKSH